MIQPIQHILKIDPCTEQYTNDDGMRSVGVMRSGCVRYVYMFCRFV